MNRNNPDRCDNSENSTSLTCTPTFRSIIYVVLQIVFWSSPAGWYLLLSTKTAGGKKKHTLSSCLTVFAYPIYDTAYCKR